MSLDTITITMVVTFTIILRSPSHHHHVSWNHYHHYGHHIQHNHIYVISITIRWASLPYSRGFSSTPFRSDILTAWWQLWTSLIIPLVIAWQDFGFMLGIAWKWPGYSLMTAWKLYILGFGFITQSLGSVVLLAIFNFLFWLEAFIARLAWLLYILSSKDVKANIFFENSLSFDELLSIQIIMFIQNLHVAAR